MVIYGTRILNISIATIYVPVGNWIIYMLRTATLTGRLVNNRTITRVTMMARRGAVAAF